jgi:hypothetical protein
MTARTQLEQALAAHIRRRSVGTALEGVPVLEGQSPGERTLPCVIVYADRQNFPEQFPPGACEITLKIYILTQADDEDVRSQNARVAAVLALLSESDSLLDELRSAALPLPQLYDIQIQSHDEGRESRHFGSVITVGVIAGS